MFKKTLAAVAVLGAFAGAATAANVTLYGVIDEGLNYNYTKIGDQDKDVYGLNSGLNSGNRWGLKGTEELGNGYTVGFQLESGFNSDDGKLGQGGRLFGRAATAYVTGPFGTLAAGRDGALDSGLGTVSYIYSYLPFGTGWGGVMKNSYFNFGYADRADNTLTYITPDLGGLKLYAQYSFQADGQEAASANDNNRYAALGAQYKAGAFSTGIVVDYLMKAETTHWVTSETAAVKANDDLKDQLKVSYGASYDFGVAKVMGMAQYSKHASKIGGTWDTPRVYDKDNAAGHVKDGSAAALVGDFEGWNLGLGVTAPLAGGTAYAQVSYVDVENNGDFTNVLGTSELADGTKYQGYGAGLGYTYPLSKRTLVYTYGGWHQLKVKDEDTTKVKVGEVGLGLVHKF